MKMNTGLGLIIGGVTIAVITLGGFYVSQNPEFIQKYKYKKQQEIRTALQQSALIAPESCKGIPADVFMRVAKNFDDVNYNHYWKQGIPDQQGQCVLDSFRMLTLFKLEFDGEPKSHLKNLETDDDIMIYAMSVKDAHENLPGIKPDMDAAETLNVWFVHKHKEGNYFN